MPALFAWNGEFRLAFDQWFDQRAAEWVARIVLRSRTGLTFLALRENEKGLSAGEKRMLAKARQILVSELTFAINVNPEEAEKKLDEALS